MIDLSAEAQRRYCRDFIRFHLARLRRSSEVLNLGGEHDSVLLREGPFLVDSLEMVQLAGLFADVLDLRTYGLEDLLLAKPSVQQWQHILNRAIEAGLDTWGFHTSGSQGEPRLVRHSWEHLVSEVALIGKHLNNWTIERVIGLVPSHHIYGFLWSILFPQMFGLPVITPGPVFTAFQDRDLVIATPFLVEQWRVREILPPPSALILVSTAPFEPKTAGWLDANSRPWVEIYGSTETGGIGFRSSTDRGFTLLDHWEWIEESGNLVLQKDGRTYAFPDHVRLEGRTVVPMGRKDGAVQVGGVNVYPQKVQAFLSNLPGVQRVWVRPHTENGSVRLKAWVIPDGSLEPKQLEISLRERCAQGLTSAERPVHFTIDENPPLSPFGKLLDW